MQPCQASPNLTVVARRRETETEFLRKVMRNSNYIRVLVEGMMAYATEISRANPSAFLFLIDQSKSMEDPFGGGAGKSRADGVADAINRLLQNLVIKCAKGEGINDYYVIGVIGYGKQVGPAFGGPLAGQHLVPIS